MEINVQSKARSAIILYYTFTFNVHSYELLSVGNGLRVRAYAIQGLMFFWFHVSLLHFKALIIKELEKWNIRHGSFTFDFNVSVASLAPRFDHSCTKVLNLLHQGFSFLRACFENETSKRKNETMKRKNETMKPKVKLWATKFRLWNNWLSGSWNIKVKHETSFTIVNHTYARVRG